MSALSLVTGEKDFPVMAKERTAIIWKLQTVPSAKDWMLNLIGCASLEKIVHSLKHRNSAFQDICFFFFLITECVEYKI